FVSHTEDQIWHPNLRTYLLSTTTRHHHHHHHHPHRRLHRHLLARIPILTARCSSEYRSGPLLFFNSNHQIPSPWGKKKSSNPSTAISHQGGHRLFYRWNRY